MAFTAFTLIAYGWRQKRDGLDGLVLLGCLVLCMLLLSPICHLHYFTLSILLIMGLTLAEWEKRSDLRVSGGLGLLLVINVVANALPNFEGLELFRDLGLAMYAAISLWLSGVGLLWRRRLPQTEAMTDGLLVQQAA